MDIQERLTKYMDELEKALSKSADFAAAEAPLVIREFLAWELWSNVFLMIVLAVSAWGAVALFRRTWNLIPKITTTGWSGDVDRQALRVISSIAMLIAVPLFSLFSIISAYGALKVAVAPRVVLLEKVAALAHGKK